MTNQTGFSVVIDPQVWYQLKKDLDAFDKTLAVQLRRRIKNAGQVAVDAVKRQLLSGGGGTNTPDYSAEVAAALAAATRLTVSFTARNAGVKIITSPNRLEFKDRKLLTAYNQETFRHPVYARKGTSRKTWTWVVQNSTPYFEPVIYETLDRVLMDEISAAIDEATEQIKNRT